MCVCVYLSLSLMWEVTCVAALHLHVRIVFESKRILVAVSVSTIHGRPIAHRRCPHQAPLSPKDGCLPDFKPHSRK